GGRASILANVLDKSDVRGSRAYGERDTVASNAVNSHDDVAAGSGCRNRSCDGCVGPIGWSCGNLIESDFPCALRRPERSICDGYGCPHRSRCGAETSYCGRDLKRKGVTTEAADKDLDSGGASRKVRRCNYQTCITPTTGRVEY